MLELICDFLNYYGMTYTKSVLLAEASLVNIIFYMHIIYTLIILLLIQ